MHMYHAQHYNLEGIVLENDFLTVCVLPVLGAKIASIFYKPQDFEVLFQPVNREYTRPSYGDEFALYDTSGSDEMFPTIDACTYPFEGYEGEAMPDHGELWSIPWNVEIAGNTMRGEVKGIRLPYTFGRSITLRENVLHFEYEVINTGQLPLCGLWAFHGLAACDEQTRILLPETERVMNINNTSTTLGTGETLHPYPLTKDSSGNEYFLDRIQPKHAQKCEKYYVNGKVNTGEAALTLHHGKLLYTLRFPKETVPYLGVWINEGGFKNEYNCALEPSTGFYDSLEIAKRHNCIRSLRPQERLTWFLDLELRDM